MQQRKITILCSIFLVILSIFIVNNKTDVSNKTAKKEKNLKATVLEVSSNYVKVADGNNIIYTFINDDNTFELGQNVNIKYTGTLDKNKENQTASIVSVSSFD